MGRTRRVVAWPRLAAASRATELCLLWRAAANPLCRPATRCACHVMDKYVVMPANVQPGVTKLTASPLVFREQMCMWFDGKLQGCVDTLGPITVGGAAAGQHQIRVRLVRPATEAAPNERMPLSPPASVSMLVAAENAIMPPVFGADNTLGDGDTFVSLNMVDGIHWRLVLPISDTQRRNSLVASYCAMQRLADVNCRRLQRYSDLACHRGRRTHHVMLVFSQVEAELLAQRDAILSEPVKFALPLSDSVYPRNVSVPASVVVRLDAVPPELLRDAPSASDSALELGPGVEVVMVLDYSKYFKLTRSSRIGDRLVFQATVQDLAPGDHVLFAMVRDKAAGKHVGATEGVWLTVAGEDAAGATIGDVSAARPCPGGATPMYSARVIVNSAAAVTGFAWVTVCPNEDPRHVVGEFCLRHARCVLQGYQRIMHAVTTRAEEAGECALTDGCMLVT